jgi:hypothetical protein
MLFFIFAGPSSDAIIARIAGRGFKPLFSLSSPGYIFQAAGGWGRTYFWQGLLTTQAISWVLFAFACLLVPRTWQQRTGKSAVSTKWAYNWKYGKATRRTKLRNKLLPSNPVLWLASRERWQLVGLWLLALLAVGVTTWLILDTSRQAWMMLTYPVGFFMLLLYLGAASQSSRFFVDARRSGLIELLLATPLSERKIVLGQWRALLRTFAIPVSVVLVLQLISSGLSHVSMRRTMAAATSAAAAASASAATNAVGTNASGGTTFVYTTTNVTPTFNPPSFASMTAQEWLTTIVNSLTGLTTSIANLVALCWFGMWMGMTSKNANLAALKTILFVQIVPFMVIAFGSSMAIGLLIMPFLARKGATSSTAFMVWYPFVSSLLMAVLFLAKDVVFFVLSRKVLYTSFRDHAVRSLSPPAVAILPPIPTPPVIPAAAT